MSPLAWSGLVSRRDLLRAGSLGVAASLWPTSWMVSAGGANGGQVIGATDKHGASPTTCGYGPADVAATIYQAIGIDPATLLADR